ncbi:transmembrane protein 177-like [Babylonia areolata]|uniref:transmembrane protein 177-like n=1 Tax=Babylonia areolata TaxID=304850 RepID=UPI003FD6A91D
MSHLREAWRGLQKNMQFVAGVGTVGLGALILYPHVWGIRRSKNVLQMYRDGKPEPVDEDSKRLAQQMFDKVLWDAASEAGVELFTAYGQDIIHRGSTFTRQGAIVGIPVNFKYRSVLDVEKEKITLNNTHIDWDSATGKQLLDSLVLSEKARQFAIARDLFYVHTFHMYVKAGLMGVSCFSAYWLGAAVNTVYGLSRRLPTASRVVIYSFFAGMGATVYCFASDSYNWFRDRKVDKQAAKLGLEYAEGGVEFYNKQLQRNMALRALLGSEGGKRYTAYGNDIHFWRSPTMPLTSRRDGLQEIVKSLEEVDSSSELPKATAPA